MKKIYNVADHYPIIVSEYPFHKELKKELIPLLENYPDEMGKRTNVKATMTNYRWGIKNKTKRLQRLKLSQKDGDMKSGFVIQRSIAVNFFI